MLWATKTVTQEELRVAATYFAKQTWPARSAGAASTPPPPGIAVCQGCHDTPAAPRLAGQSYEYLVEAMRRFADGERKNNAIMMKMMAATPGRRPGGDGALPVRPLIGSSVMVRMFQRLLLLPFEMTR